MSGEVHRGQIFQGIVDHGKEFRFILKEMKNHKRKNYKRSAQQLDDVLSGFPGLKFLRDIGLNFTTCDITMVILKIKGLTVLKIGEEKKVDDMIV